MLSKLGLLEIFQYAAKCQTQSGKTAASRLDSGNVCLISPC